MQLLVSVTDAEEARAALAGGAHIIDAKDPRSGPLGAVGLSTLEDIHSTLRRARPVSAALGDANEPAAIAETARRFAEIGTAFVKVGFAGVSDAAAVRYALSTIVDAVGSVSDAGVVAVAYADADSVGSPPVPALIKAMEGAGVTGLLVDTADKTGPGLLRLVTPATLQSWVSEVHARGWMAAVAGKLDIGDLPILLDSGVDIAGVRGGACVGGRNGQVSPERVRMLRGQLEPVLRA